MPSVAASIVVICFFVGTFIVALILFIRQAFENNKDYAAEDPDSAFAHGMDAAWKGAEPPPSKQDRSEHIRRSAISDANLAGLAPSLRQSHIASAYRRADEVAARARAHVEKSGPTPPQK